MNFCGVLLQTERNIKPRNSLIFFFTRKCMTGGHTLPAAIPFFGFHGGMYYLPRKAGLTPNVENSPMMSSLG